MLEDEIKPMKTIFEQLHPEHYKETIRACTEAGLEKEKAIHKFKFFFAGLIFAVLSFVIQFPVKSNSMWIKIIEAMSWILLGLTGVLALRNVGGFSLEDTIEGKYRTGLTKQWRFVMWTLFAIGIFMILLAKISNSFLDMQQITKTQNITLGSTGPLRAP